MSKETQGICSKATAQALGWNVGYADINDKWVLLNPFGDYRGSFDTEEAAWQAVRSPRQQAVMHLAKEKRIEDQSECKKRISTI